MVVSQYKIVHFNLTTFFLKNIFVKIFDSLHTVTYEYHNQNINFCWNTFAKWQRAKSCRYCQKTCKTSCQACHCLLIMHHVNKVKTSSSLKTWFSDSWSSHRKSFLRRSFDRRRLSVWSFLRTDIWPFGQLTAGHLSARTFDRLDISPHGQLTAGHFSARTFDRSWTFLRTDNWPQDISPHGHLTAWTFFRPDFWLLGRLTSQTFDRSNIWPLTVW